MPKVQSLGSKLRSRYHGLCLEHRIEFDYHRKLYGMADGH